jgi:hypothetical protein
MEQDRDTYKALIDSTINTNSTKSITGALANTGYKNLADSVVFKNENSGKDNVRFATTGAVTLATGFEDGDTIDGVTLVTGNRFLNKDAAVATENGIYTVNASGAPTRATDFDDSSEIRAGQQVYVEEGTANGGKYFYLSAPTGTITLGVSNLVFSPSASTVVDINGASAFSGTIDATNDKALMYDASDAANKGIALGRFVPTYGTFTPAIAFGGGTTGITYGTGTGKTIETVLDNGDIRVDYDIYIEITNDGTSTGSMKVTGLTRTPNGNYTTGSVFSNSNINNVARLFGMALSGTTTIQIYAPATNLSVIQSGTEADETDTGEAGTSILYLNGWYIHTP